MRFVVAVLTGLVAFPAFGQQARPAPAPEAAPEPADDGEIVVTGQRQPGSVTGDIKPELQLGPADIRSYGVSSIADLLSELSPQTRSDRGTGGAPFVLLNGRRISGFSEIRDIPTEAILRVDILPEEVALKYGAPASARVVNIVLRPRFRAKTVEAKGGGATDGGAANAEASANYLRIQKNGRLSVDLNYGHSDALTEAERGIVAAPARGPVAPSGVIPDLAQFRTLTRASDSGALNAVYNHVLSDGVAATINLRVQYDEGRGANGLATTLLTLPPGSPFAPPTGPPLVLRYVPELGGLAIQTRASQIHVGGTLTGDGAQWHWSLIGNFDRSDTRTSNAIGADASGFQAAVLAGANPLGPFAGGVVARARNTSSNLGQSGSLDALVSGPLLKLPAGTANVSVKLLGSASGADASSFRAGVTAATHFNRELVSGQVNLDLPLTSRKSGFGGVVGDITLNGNFAAQQLSDFGTLTTVGFGVNWTPIKALSVIASQTTDQNAPSAQQLQGPVIATPNVIVFDPASGTTAIVTQISGGVASLVASERRVNKLEFNLKPFAKPDLTLTTNYVRTRLTNAIANFPATSAAIEAAFPTRFMRDASGALVTLDARPVNFARQATDTLRWGANLSIPLKSTQVNPFAGQRPPGEAPRPGGGAAGGGVPGGGGGGAGGGRGGFGGGGFGGGGQNGGRLQFAVYHSIVFRDDVLIRPGVPVLDLLDGGALGTGGGRARHEVEVQSGFSKDGIGARLSGNWRSGTSIDASAANPNGALTFSPLATANVRLFANLAQMPQLVRDHPWLRGARVTLAVTNITNSRQRVRDATGATPLAYQPAYLDPVGRTVSISFRKLFFTPPQRRQP